MKGRPLGGARRRVPAIARRPSILVFTEGRKTEPIYLQHWHRLHRDQVIVTIDDFHGGPLQLAQRACARRESDLREERRGRGDAFSEYWCVFDVDEHAGIPQAIALAAEHGIHIAISNPCIELWFMIHFQDQWASLDRRKAQDVAEALLGCAKTPTARALEQLVHLHDKAVSRARALDRKHEGDGSPARSNPSTDVWRLIDRIVVPARNSN